MLRYSCLEVGLEGRSGKMGVHEGMGIKARGTKALVVGRAPIAFPVDYRGTPPIGSPHFHQEWLRDWP